MSSVDRRFYDTGHVLVLVPTSFFVTGNGVSLRFHTGHVQLVFRDTIASFPSYDCTVWQLARPVAHSNEIEHYRTPSILGISLSPAAPSNAQIAFMALTM